MVSIELQMQLRNEAASLKKWGRFVPKKGRAVSIPRWTIEMACKKTGRSASSSLILRETGPARPGRRGFLQDEVGVVLAPASTRPPVDLSRLNFQSGGKRIAGLGRFKASRTDPLLGIAIVGTDLIFPSALKNHGTGLVAPAPPCQFHGPTRYLFELPPLGRPAARGSSSIIAAGFAIIPQRPISRNAGR